jgi:hypothetical protein
MRDASQAVWETFVRHSLHTFVTLSLSAHSNEKRGE